jgi:hypothetical protein
VSSNAVAKCAKHKENHDMALLDGLATMAGVWWGWGADQIEQGKFDLLFSTAALS